MDTIQIEITNVCHLNCSNCTRFVGHHKKPYFMSWEDFKKAIDSLYGAPKMIGFQGGEPLFHPEFERFCDYAASKFPKDKLGLWTTLPKGYERYRDIICDTFAHIFINDHTRNDIYHHPSLVGIEDVVKDKDEMWYMIDHCWAQECWSASINPKGAYFCEMAAAFAMLYDGPDGWPVEPGWWKKTRKDYREQMEHFCPKCGMAAPLKLRSSIENTDDISPNHYEKLKDSSRKIKNGQFIINDLKPIEKEPDKMAAYKDFDYRNKIAKRYGMFLVINDKGFWSPFLYRDTEEKKWEKSEWYTYKNDVVPGLMFFDKEMQWLKNTSQYMDSVVEIGAWKGASTMCFLTGCKGQVYAVDHFLGSNEELDQTRIITNKEEISKQIETEFLKNCGHFPNMKLLKMYSHEAAKQFEDKSVDMVYIDAEHTYEEVIRDIESWMPKARKMICGHDYHIPGVQRALIEKFSDGTPSKISLAKRHFHMVVSNEKINPGKKSYSHDIYLNMIPNFRTIPNTTFWVVDLE